MKGDDHLRQEDFDGLLALFSEDREEAGRIYERIRRGLVVYFGSKGCSDAIHLADKTLNRVASKASAFVPGSRLGPVGFVYGFASRVFLEEKRDGRTVALGFDPEPDLAGIPETKDAVEVSLDCMERCLDRLAEADRDLLIEYYSREGPERAARRKEIAKELGIRIECLHVKVFRIRVQLRSCISQCRSSEDGQI